MANLKNLRAEELEKIISKRQKEIIEILEFVSAIIRERGRVTREEVGDWNIKMERELKQFANFSFYSFIGQSMMGGNTFKIWYHGADQAAVYYKTTLVLEVYYQSNPDECRVMTFDTTTDWLPELKKVMADKDKIVKELEEKEDQRRKKDKTEAEDKVKKDKLLKRAGELGL